MRLRSEEKSLFSPPTSTQEVIGGGSSGPVGSRGLMPPALAGTLSQTAIFLACEVRHWKPTLREAEPGAERLPEELLAPPGKASKASSGVMRSALLPDRTTPAAFFMAFNEVSPRRC